MCRLSDAELNCVSTKMRFRPGVQAVADRDVDQPVLAADRHRRLRAHVREREEAASASAAQNQGKHVVHAEDVSGIVGDFARPSRIRRRFVTLSRDDRCRSVAGGRSCEGGRTQRADVPRNASGSPSPITGRRPGLTPPVRARRESASVIQACVAETPVGRPAAHARRPHARGRAPHEAPDAPHGLSNC